MDLGSKKRVRLGMTSASSKKWQPSSQRDRSLQSIPCTSIKENSRSGRQLGKPNGFQAKGDEQVAYKSEVIPENRHRRSEDSIVYSPIFPSSPETPNTADVSTSNDILSIGNEDSETTSNNYLCKWDKENRNLPVLIEQRTTSMPFSSPVAKDYTCWTKNNTSDRQSFSPITRTPSSLFSHNIANNVIDRMRINFLKVYTKAPILSSSINSECAEIAVCEAAFVNDIDSQFDCDTFFGLPLIVKELLAKYKNISHLYGL